MDRSSSHDLHIPLELHHAISEQCDTSALAVYARVDRAMWNICTAILYRDVKLESLKEAIQFCKTLVHNPKLAEPVQSLDIRHDFFTRVYLLAASAALFKSAFRMLCNLTEFSFLLMGVSERHFCDMYSHHPRLKTLQITTPLSNYICRWIEKHENLESIGVYTRMPTTIDMPRRGSLRNLRRVEGNPTVISRLLLPGSLVEHVVLTILEIDYLHEAFIDLLLGAMSNLQDDLKCLQVHVHCNEREDVSAWVNLLRLLPRLQRVEVLGIIIVGREAPENTLDVLGKFVSSLPCVRTMHFLPCKFDDTHLSFYGKEDGELCFETTKRWGQSCPQLKMVILGNHISVVTTDGSWKLMSDARQWTSDRLSEQSDILDRRIVDDMRICCRL